MMQKKIWWRFLFIASILSQESMFAQSVSALIAKGNKAYEEKNYSQAENYYRQATMADQQHEFPQGTFNLGNALFMQKKFDEAAKQFQQLVDSKQKTAYIAPAYFNLGNCLLAQKKFPQSADAYKRTLLINPGDHDARYNLSLAMVLMNGATTYTSSNNSPSSQNNLPKEPPPVSQEEMKNLLSQLSNEEGQTLDSMKRRTFSRKQKKDW
jgi:tetratricopeptide (TPR) repeat protein